MWSFRYQDRSESKSSRCEPKCLSTFKFDSQGLIRLKLSDNNVIIKCWKLFDFIRELNAYHSLICCTLWHLVSTSASEYRRWGFDSGLWPSCVEFVWKYSIYATSFKRRIISGQYRCAQFIPFLIAVLHFSCNKLFMYAFWNDLFFCNYRQLNLTMPTQTVNNDWLTILYHQM